jgi:hypothetical protein
MYTFFSKNFDVPVLLFTFALRFTTQIIQSCFLSPINIYAHVAFKVKLGVQEEIELLSLTVSLLTNTTVTHAQSPCQEPKLPFPHTHHKCQPINIFVRYKCIPTVHHTLSLMH